MGSKAKPYKPGEDPKADAVVALCFPGLLVPKDKPNDMAAILKSVFFDEKGQKQKDLK